MKIPFVIFVSCLLGGCGGGPLGLGSSQSEPINYSPRSPLVMPPPEQRNVLPAPQDAVPQSVTEMRAQPAPGPIAPQPLPANYSSSAPLPEGAPAEEKSWLGRMFD